MSDHDPTAERLLFDIFGTPDHGDGLRARVEELEQRIARAEHLLFIRTPAGDPARPLVDDVRAILRGDL